MWRNVLFRQVLHHGFGPALAESIVVSRAANRVGAALHHHYVAFGVGNVGNQLVQGRFGFLGEIGLVESKVDRGFNHGLVIVEIGHLVGQRVDPAIGLRSQGLGLVGAAAGVSGFLVGG